MRIYAPGRLSFFGFVITLLVVACAPDPNAEANKLFVEAQQLMEKAEQQRPNDKLINLRDAEARLKSIVSKYPSANLAVQLASGQNVGKLSLQGVVDAIVNAKREACFEAPNKKCLFEQALSAAQPVKDHAVLFSWPGGSSNFSRIGFLGAVGSAQAKAGLKQDSDATFQEATRAYEIQKKETRSFGLSLLAPALAGAGRTTDALRLIEDVSDEEQRSGLLFSIARAQAIAGFNVDAASTLDKAVNLRPPGTGDESARANRATRIAGIQAMLGLSKEAADTLDEAIKLTKSGMPNDASRRALGSIAEVQLILGQSAAAFDSLTRALDIAKNGPSADSNIFLLLSGKAALAGIIDVRKIANVISNEYMKSSILYEGAKGCAEAGRIPEAQEIIYAIKTDYFRAQALSALAQAQAKAKLTSQAAKTVESVVQTLQSLSNDIMRPYVLLAVAQAVPQ